MFGRFSKVSAMFIFHSKSCSKFTFENFSNQAIQSGVCSEKFSKVSAMYFTYSDSVVEETVRISDCVLEESALAGV